MRREPAGAGNSTSESASRQLDILYFYQYFGTSKGSWSTRVHEFARRWVEKGDRVTVITSVYDKSDLKSKRWYWTEQIDGIDVRVLNIRLSNKHSPLLRIPTYVAYGLLSCWFAVWLRRRGGHED